MSEGANRPHRCNKGFHLRNGAGSQKMSTHDITAFIQAEGKVRFNQQLRLDLIWKEVRDENRLNYFLKPGNISPKPRLIYILSVMRGLALRFVIRYNKAFGRDSLKTK